MIVYEKPAEYRGTIEVYGSSHEGWFDWYWRARSNNTLIVADGGRGYSERNKCVKAADKVLGAVMHYDDGHAYTYVVPWRLVIRDRRGNIEHIGAVY